MDKWYIMSNCLLLSIAHEKNPYLHYNKDMNIYSTEMDNMSHIDRTKMIFDVEWENLLDVHLMRLQDIRSDENQTKSKRAKYN